MEENSPNEEIDVPSDPVSKKRISNRSLLARAGQNDQEALHLIFTQFIEEDEIIEMAECFGNIGLIFPIYSFGCITNKRIAALKVGFFDYLSYRDMALEEVKSVAIEQSNILLLIFSALVFTVITLGLGLIFLDRFVRTYYKVNKIGMTFCNSKELEVFIAADKSKIKKLNSMSRKVSKLIESTNLTLKGND